MPLNNERKKRIENQFDRFCKLLLANKAKNIIIEQKKHLQREISLEDLDYHEVLNLVTDANFDQSEQDLKKQKSINLLRTAIQKLSDQNRQIIIYCYWLNMSDQEISKKLQLPRRTVNYKRNRALQTLRKILEENKSD